MTGGNGRAVERLLEYRGVQLTLGVLVCAIAGALIGSGRTQTLTVIGIATEIMAAPQSSPERRQEYHERVKRQIAAITELVGDILEFSQTTAPQNVFAAISYKEFIEGLACAAGHLNAARVDISVRKNQKRQLDSTSLSSVVIRAYVMD